MALTIRLYNHNAGSTGVNTVRVGYGNGSQYQARSFDMTDSVGTSGFSISGITPNISYPISFEITDMDSGYEFVCWHITLGSSTYTSRDEVYEIYLESTYNGTLHIWPEVEYTGGGGGGEEDEENEWFVGTLPFVSNLTDVYSLSHYLAAYECLRVDFSCQSGGEIELYTTGSLDTLGYLCEYGADLNYETGRPDDYLATNDDDGDGNNFRIRYEIEPYTSYSLFIRTYGGDDDGSIRVHISPPIAPSTFIVSNMVIGSNPTFSFTRYSSSVTETLAYNFYGLTGTIVSDNTEYDYSGWTIPQSFMEKIPNAQSGICNILCITYRNGVEIGTYTKQVTVYAPSDINPILDPVIKDIKPETIALTGDENIIVKNISMVEYAINAVPLNGATIVEQYIENGSQRKDLPQGIIDEPESGIFIVSATDSRGLTTTATVEKALVEYIKPTCYQKVKMEMSGAATLRVYGSYFTDTFGAVKNDLKIEVRHTQNDGTMGEWIELTNGLVPVFGDNSYTLDITIRGFDYRNAYTFQCRATDKLYSVASQSYVVRWLPVFDWSEDDFNFNVPININADTLDMHDQTVLRHNIDADNTVLSATGGHVYIRPGGTEDTSSETIFYPDGSVSFSGEITVNGEKIGGGASDYIVETGTEAMGTNGTWYWEKWESGKAVCWGKRNFGAMAITTQKVDDVYRSSTYTQSFPSGLFSAAPDFMDIRTYPNGASNYRYCWIGTDGTTAASAASTGTFCVMSCISTTASASDITFHIIGRWR